MQKKRKWIKLLAVVIAAIIVLVIMMIPAMIRDSQKQQEKELPASGTLTVDTRSKEKKSEEVSKRPDYVYFSGLEDKTLEKGGSIILENPVENDKDVYIVFDIYADGSLIHETGLCPRGKAIDYAPELEAGDYELTVENIPYFEENGEYHELSHGSNTIHLTVK